jgi:hypothetical protein
VLLGAWLVLPRPASGAEPNAEAERLIRHGLELRKAHDEEAAVRDFQEAYGLVRTPRAAGQLGLAEQALGRWEDAEQHVREALEADADPWVIKNHAVLGEAMGLIQGHLGRVEIVGEPAGAEVLVNGRAAGTLPLAQPVPVSAGDVDVELRAPGYQPGQRTLALAAGQYRRIVLRLAREPAGAAAVDTPPAASAVTPPEVEPAAAMTEVSKPAETPVEPPSTARAVVKWSAAGLAVGSLGLGIAFTIVQRKNVAAFDSYRNCQDRDGTAVVWGTTVPMPLCQQALHDYLIDEKVAIAGFVGAGAFAITWLVLQLTEPPRATRKGETALAPTLCVPTAGPAGVACAWRF